MNNNNMYIIEVSKSKSKKLNIRKVILAIILLSLILVALINMIKKTVSANTLAITLETIEIGSIISDEPSYVALHYPIVALEKINLAVYEMVEQELNSFKTESSKATSKEKSELYMNFKTSIYETHVISFNFKISKNIPGVASNVETVKILNFNIDNGEQIFLDDKTLAEGATEIEREPQGEEASPEKTDPPKENVDELKNKKLIALTFDDGPHSKYTKELLKILKEEDAKATFFVLGSRAKYYPEILKQAAEEGHQIGNHSYSHKQLASLEDKKIKDEIDRTNKIIKDATGIGTIALRPPYGEADDKTKKIANSPIILWSVDPEDWKLKDAKKVAKSVVKNTKEGSIILMHDIYPTTIEATKQIIKDLKKKGYTFVTVETMIKAKQGEVVNNKIYYNVK
jgi:peptidoglycan/xylan/chitin deacetylase (PgdA/CDA1 family)